MSPTITLDAVAEVLAPRLPIYRWRRPVYQTAMLRDLQRVWRGPHARVLDVGGGTGVIAQAVKDLFGVTSMISVDVEDRFLSDLTVETHIFDGVALPFAKGDFDAVMFNNVIHHAPPAARAALMRECRRVAGRGPIYIKDHLAVSRADHLRLGVLDWLGNTPFKGMIAADYLEASEWEALAAAAGSRIAETLDKSGYRSGPMAALFPNRLEITMRWDAASCPGLSG